MRNHIPKVESLFKKKKQNKKPTKTKTPVINENAKNRPEKIYVQQETARGSAAPAGLRGLDFSVAGRDAARPRLLVRVGSACPTRPAPGDEGPRGPGQAPQEQKATGARPAGPWLMLVCPETQAVRGRRGDADGGCDVAVMQHCLLRAACGWTGEGSSFGSRSVF